MRIPPSTHDEFAAPTGCLATVVVQSKEGAQYEFSGVANHSGCHAVATLDQFTDAFVAHCGVSLVDQDWNASWAHRSISGGPALALFVPPGQTDAPLIPGCLNFTAMEVGYPRSLGLRLGLCAGLPWGLIGAAWAVMGFCAFRQRGRRRHWAVPPAPPNSLESTPRPSLTASRSDGACVALDAVAAGPSRPPRSGP